MRILFLFLLAFVNIASANKIDPKTYIPENAFKHIPELNEQLDNYWSKHPYREYFGGLIEHESCITLKHSRCWSSSSRLVTAREEGAGLGQITRTFNSDGSIRFDSLADMARIHKTALAEATWKNIYTRPDLQIRMIILKSRDDYRRFPTVKNELERLKLTDASYNQGVGRTIKERNICGLSKDCDPNIWDNNVSKKCTATKKIGVYGRSGCEISRHHVHDVFNVRMNKYKPLLAN